MEFKKPSFSRKRTEVVLLPELVPSSAWNVNLRSELKAVRWDEIRKFVYRRAGYRCEICGGRGVKHPVEAHEKWEYKKGVQRLVGLLALCPSCHECKHLGLAEVRGRLEVVIGQMIKVNGMSRAEVLKIVEGAKREWFERSKSGWILDLSHIETLEC